jgi:hypothetical protein
MNVCERDGLHISTSLENKMGLFLAGVSSAISAWTLTIRPLGNRHDLQLNQTALDYYLRAFQLIGEGS